MASSQIDSGEHVALRVVLRNTTFMVAGKVLGMPLSLAVTIFAARHLGADVYGQLYLATTFVALAFMFVEWGQGGGLTGAMARQREQAGELLASGIAIRLMLAPLALGIMMLASCALHYDASFRLLLVLATLAALSTSLSTALQDTFRSFERADLSAKANVATQDLTAAIVLPVLFLGGGVHAFVLAQAGCAFLGALILSHALRKLGVKGLRVRLASMRQLLVQGVPFLIFGLILVLQPSVDAFFLSKLAPADVVGWNAAARKIIGVLIYPTSALIGSLYPTLCRLLAHDPDRFGATVSGTLRMAMLISIPAGFGCILFPELGVAAFGVAGYAHTSENLRVLGIFIVLVYVSMPIGSALMALGRRRAWSAVQFICVVVSVVLDPVLIPWFQSRYGNGGLGVCVANAASELIMVAGGSMLLPRGVFDAKLARTLLAVAGAGLCMALIAAVASGWNPWIAAPCSLLGYAAVMWFAGEIRGNKA